mmetsp:Transcript_41088/g.86315  ORF Transcript_41088/g.86315 Transcript_41088/m.86315 type:complete len:477 (+) Transcript_41088:40-1470(+)
MMVMAKSINSRRGGGGAGPDTSMTWWKYIFLASLILLISFLVRLNYQLVKEIGRPTSAASTSGGGSEGDHGDAAAEERLNNLRREVKSFTANLGTMKDTVKVLEQQQQGGEDEYPRLTCTPDVSQKQANRMNARFMEWWSHSACPDQVWMENIRGIFDDASHQEQRPAQNYLVLDIGCNKGYTSADFLDALSPGTNMNPSTLVGAIRAIAREMNTKFDRDGGVCNDSNKPLNKDRNTKSTMEVHCFEPSPATYNMLIKAREKLIPGADESVAKWHIHNEGLHEVNGQMSWHSACATAVGDELCTIVPDGTADSITVPVVTVDKFLDDTYSSGGNLPLVHMLKIDAEGLDPAVINGAHNLLKAQRAVMVMFEFNPGLSEGKGPPHGMWGNRGNPRKRLLEVTNSLDTLGYDCYLDTRLVDENERSKNANLKDAPALYRITGQCLTDEPGVRGWANVVCAARKFKRASGELRSLASMV